VFAECLGGFGINPDTAVLTSVLLEQTPFIGTQSLVISKMGLENFLR
jgi:hypothetical protein